MQNKAKSRRWWKQNIEMANNAIYCGFVKKNDYRFTAHLFEATKFAAEGILYHAKEAYKDSINEVVMEPVGKSIKVKGATRYAIYLKRA